MLYKLWDKRQHTVNQVVKFNMIIKTPKRWKMYFVTN